MHVHHLTVASCFRIRRFNRSNLQNMLSSSPMIARPLESRSSLNTAHQPHDDRATCISLILSLATGFIIELDTSGGGRGDMFVPRLFDL